MLTRRKEHFSGISMTSISLLLVSFLLVTYLFSGFNETKASTIIHVAGASGAFATIAPAVQYMGPASSCASNESAISIVLAGASATTSIIDNNPTDAKWVVRIRTRTGEIIRSQTLSASITTSNSLCFDPALHGVQVSFLSSANSLFNTAMTPTTFFDNNQQVMEGNHYRGYLHLWLKTQLNPIVESIGQNSYWNTKPLLRMQTNYLPNLYNVTAVSYANAYIVNQSTGDKQMLSSPTVGTVGTRDIPSVPDDLPEGYYTWLFHQNFDGTANTKREGTVYNWTFTETPNTSATKPAAFVIDRTPPQIDLWTPQPFVSEIRADGRLAICRSASMQDTLSGYGFMRYIAYDTENQPFSTITIFHGGALPPTQQQNMPACVWLNPGTIMDFELIGQDAAGNITDTGRVTYTVPPVSSLTTPTVTAGPVEDISTISARLSANVTHNGGSHVNRRGICVYEALSDVVDEINNYACRASSTISVHNFDASDGLGVFTEHVNGLEHSKTYWYRGFAVNASGFSFGPMQSFDTPIPISAQPLPPTVTAFGAINGSAETAYLAGVIQTHGGDYVSVTHICIAMDSINLPIIPSGPNCQSDFGFDRTRPLPASFYRVFENLPYFTRHYFRVYATNQYGTSYADGTFLTEPAWFDFQAETPVITTRNTIEIYQPEYNLEAGRYNFEFAVNGRDLSNHRNGNPHSHRSVNYLVELLSAQSNNVVDSIVGSMLIYPENFIKHEFHNLPPGVYIVKLTVNIDPTSYIESDGTLAPDRTANNVTSVIVNLPDPTTYSEVLQTVGGVSLEQLPDPGILLTQPNQLIRSGSETTLTWDVIETYPMNCHITGPGSFAQGGVYSFDPSVDGPTGSISTGILRSAQLFELTCVEPITGSNFRTTTRINVAGSLKEL